MKLIDHIKESVLNKEFDFKEHEYEKLPTELRIRNRDVVYYIKVEPIGNLRGKVTNVRMDGVLQNIKVE